MADVRELRIVRGPTCMRLVVSLGQLCVSFAAPEGVLCTSDIATLLTGLIAMLDRSQNDLGGRVTLQEMVREAMEKDLSEWVQRLHTEADVLGSN